MQRFPAAPWPASLKVKSLLGTAVLGGVAYAFIKVIPGGMRFPFAEEFGMAVASVPPLVGAIALMFVVTGYEVGPDELRIQRLLWSTRLSLTGLTRAWFEPHATDGSLRLFGNGGLYSFTGLFRNRTLGRYRAFVTDPQRTVVLQVKNRVVVLSPAEPHAFLQALTIFSPRLVLTHPGGAA